MVAYSFQARFAPLVAAGTKRQTIRAPRAKSRHARAGDPLTFLTGPRMSPERIGKSTCLYSAKCEIDIDGNSIEITRSEGDGLSNWQVISDPQRLEAFARADGFGSWADMKGWFRATHGGEKFTGVLIVWGELEKPQ